MQKLLIMIPLVSSVLILSGFSFFSAFHFCNDDKPSKAFLIALGIFSFLIAVFIAVGIMTCD